MLKKLIEILHSGNHSLVIANGDDIRTYDGRGVADLYRLLTTETSYLDGASVADKVIGIGAAALMISGGVNEVYTDVISRGALSIFKTYGKEPEYKTVVDHILNRSEDDWCPVEKLCSDAAELTECTKRIGQFLKSSKK